MDRDEYEIRVTEYLMKRPKEAIISLFLQVEGERNIAISQLNELGYSLGEKVKK